VAKLVTDFDEIRVRNFPLEKKVRLAELATKQGKSLNQFLSEVLMKVAETHEDYAIDYKYQELSSQTLEALNVNTAELKKVQELIKFLIGE